MKNSIMGFMILVGSFVAPLCADVCKTRQEIVRLMARHEGLSDQEQTQLAQLLQDPILGERIPYANFPEKAKVGIDKNMLRVLKPFAKTPGNPLFKECLFNAICLGCNNRVRKLVSSFGVSANTVWGGKTALHQAMIAEIDQQGAVSIVNFLLENGAELEVQDQQDGLTPLGYGVMYVPNCAITQQMYQGVGKEVPEEESLGVERTRKNVDKIYEIPAVAEQIMQREGPIFRAFLPKQLANLVMEYEHPHLTAIRPYAGQDYERDMAVILAQQSDVADGGPEQNAGIGAAGDPAVDADLTGDSVWDLDEELEGEPAGVPYLS